MKEFIIQMLPVVMSLDIRLQVHSYKEVDGIWTHVDKSCPLCCSNYILELSTAV